MTAQDVILFGTSALDYWRVRGGAKLVPDAAWASFKGAHGAPTDSYTGRALAFAREQGLRLPLQVCAASKETRRSNAYVRPHVWACPPGLPQARLAGPGVRVPPPALALAQAATELDFVDLLIAALEFLGCYLLSPESKAGMVDTKKPLVTPEELANTSALLQRLGRRGSERLAEVAKAAAPGSKSPMESKLYVLFSLGRKRGGFGIPGILLNPRIALDERASASFGYPSIRPDLLEPRGRTAIEYQSSLHLLDGREKDDRRADVLEAQGIRTFQVNAVRARSLHDLAAIAQVMAQRAGIQRRPPSAQACVRRQELHARLFCSNEPPL